MDDDQSSNKFHSKFLQLLPNQNNAKANFMDKEKNMIWFSSSFTFVDGFLHIFENIRSILLNKRFNAGRNCSCDQFVQGNNF